MYQNTFLIIIAIFPALFILWRVYQSDTLEKEPIRLIRKLILGGMGAVILAILTEVIGTKLLPLSTPFYYLIMMYIVVALSEEGFKYLLLHKIAWKHPSFDCFFDGIVYATTVSLGFALFENILYVVPNGISVAVARSLTAVPGHACFGVLMGIFFAHARKYENQGNIQKSKQCRILSVVVPALAHGTYDYLATTSTTLFSILLFVVFVIMLFSVCIKFINYYSKNDQFI